MLKKILFNPKSNFLSLIVMQGSNALIPLFIFPYLLSILGTDSFSQLVISETLSIIILAFVLFGFDIVSIKKLAKTEHIIAESEVFFSVFYSRLLIFLVFIPFSVIIYFVFDVQVLSLYLCWLLVPLGHIFQNSYFYLYKQSNFVLAVATLASRISGLFLIILFVEGPSDVLSVPLILGSTYMVGAIASFIFVVKYWRLKIQFPNGHRILADLKEGCSYFVSNVSVLLYRDLNVVIMSLVFRDANAISIYALAEKIVKSVQAVFRPISQFYFTKTVMELKCYDAPSLAALKVVWKFTYKQLTLFTCLFTVGVAVVYFFEVKVVSIISLPVFDALIFSIPMMLVIYFAIPNYMLGMVGLNVLGGDRYLAKSILITGFVNVLTCLVVSYMFGAAGAAVCFVVSEFFLLTLILKKYTVNTSRVNDI